MIIPGARAEAAQPPESPRQPPASPGVGVPAPRVTRAAALNLQPPHEPRQDEARTGAPLPAVRLQRERAAPEAPALRSVQVRPDRGDQRKGGDATGVRPGRGREPERVAGEAAEGPAVLHPAAGRGRARVAGAQAGGLAGEGGEEGEGEGFELEGGDLHPEAGVARDSGGPEQAVDGAEERRGQGRSGEGGGGGRGRDQAVAAGADGGQAVGGEGAEAAAVADKCDEAARAGAEERGVEHEKPEVPEREADDRVRGEEGLHSGSAEAGGRYKLATAGGVGANQVEAAANLGDGGGSEIAEQQIKIMNRENWSGIYHDIVDSLRLKPRGGLMVLSSGICTANLTSLLLSYFMERSKAVVILLNFSAAEVDFIDYHLKVYAQDNKLVNNQLYCQEIYQLTKLPTDKRAALYKAGGFYSISNQVFIQDLLTTNVSPFIITHLIVNQAQDITSKFDYECWIANYIKCSKLDIFTLALTNQASILHCRQNTQQLLRFLYVDDVFLWPINRVQIVKNLREQNKHFHEFQLSIAPKVKELQDCLMSLIEICIQHVNSKTHSRYVTSEMIFQLTERKIKAIIQKQAQRVDIANFQAFTDIFELRKLLICLTNANAFQFYLSLQQCSQQATEDSIWYQQHPDVEKFTSKIQKLAAQRVYQLTATEKAVPYADQDLSKDLKFTLSFNLKIHPKTSLLVKILGKIGSEFDSVQKVWVWVRNRQNVTQLQQQLSAYYKLGDKCNALAQFNALRMQLKDFTYQDKLQPPKQSQPFKPRVVLKHNKKEIVPAKQEDTCELFLRRILKKELDHYYSNYVGKREQILIDGEIKGPAASPITYQLLPKELVELDVSKIGQYIDQDGVLREFDEDSVVPNCTVIVNSLDNESLRLAFLGQYKPDHIVILDPHHPFLKELIISEYEGQIYNLIQQDCIESWMYHQEKLDEEQAFEALLQDQGACNREMPKDAILMQEQQGSTRIGRGEAFFKEQKSQPTVFVDYREFRCDIPPKLYYSGYQIVPVMLKVGDIILSNSCAIERKCVETGDFNESIQNSRLDEQLKRMNQFEYPFLLIEFSENIPFSLQSLYRQSYSSTNTKILLRLLELVQKYNKISILWSKSSDDTIKILSRLKQTYAKSTPELVLFKSNLKEPVLPQEKITNYFSQLDSIIQ